MSIRTWSSLAAIAVVAVLCSWLPARGHGLVQALAEAAFTLVAWSALRQQPGPLRRGWGVVALGMGLGAASDLVAGVGLLFGVSPTGSGAVLLAAGYLATAVGAVQVLRRRRSVRRDGWADVAVVAVAGFAPMAAFVVMPQLALTGSSGEHLLVVVYALADLAVIALIARLAIGGDGALGSRALLFICMTVLASVLAALLSTLAGNGLQSTTQMPVRLLWVATYLFYAVAMCHRSLRAVTTGAPTVAARDRGGERGRIVVLTVGLLLPIATLAAGLVRHDPAERLMLTAVDSVVVAALVGVRMTALLTQMARQADQLTLVAHADDLTGLLNRRGWEHAVQSAGARAVQERRPLSLAVLELDGFDGFNHLQGRPTGDRFLRTLASVWSDALGEGEVVARYNGVQFGFVLPGLAGVAALARVEELRQLVPAPQTASAGVAEWAATGAAAVLLDVDGALYTAKCDGGARTAVAEHGVDQVPGPLRDLQIAVQPIVRLADDRVVAHECLSRFPHTTAIESVFADAHEKGFGDLLEVAAINGVLARPHRPAGTEVYVNVSERAVRSARFWEHLPEDLGGVVVELVEHRDGLSETAIRNVLERLRARGARVALDDVGSSATDFARIASLRPDIAKIDRRLVAGCDLRESQAQVLAMLVDFAMSHGAEVVVEGIETAGELEVARRAGATYAQGYLLGRPCPDWTAASSSSSGDTTLVAG